MNKQEVIEQLMRIHYNFFMVKKDFWYSKAYQEADKLIVVAASNLREEIRKGLQGDINTQRPTI